MKYKIGDKVRAIRTNRIFTIERSGTVLDENIYWMKECAAWIEEGKLKPYRPSRTGKYRNEKGQFRKECKLYLDEDMNIRGCICGECDKNNKDSKQRNTKILENINTDIRDIDRDYQDIISKIEASKTSLYNLKKKIDKLNNL